MATGKEIFAKNHKVRIQRKNAFRAFVLLAETVNGKKVSEMHKLHKYELYAYASRWVGYGRAVKYTAEKAVKQAYLEVNSIIREAPHASPTPMFNMQVYLDFGGVVYRNALDIENDFGVKVSRTGYHLTEGGFGKNEDVFFAYSANPELYDVLQNMFFFAPLERVLLPEQFDTKHPFKPKERRKPAA